MVRLFRFIILLIMMPSAVTYAQTHEDTGYVKDIKVYPGKEFAPAEINTIDRINSQRNASVIGQRYVPFDLHTSDGQRINNTTSQGKVTLFAFWYVSTNYELIRLNALYEKFRKEDPSFQLVLVTFDTTGLNEYFLKNHISFPYATVRWQQDVKNMNYNNSMPSFVVLNRAGIVSEVTALHYKKPSEIEEIDNTVSHLLSVK